MVRQMFLEVAKLNMLHHLAAEAHKGYGSIMSWVFLACFLWTGMTIQYRPQALQHLHARKLHAIWRISTKNPRKKLACKFLHKLLHADFLHANLSVLLR